MTVAMESFQVNLPKEFLPVIKMMEQARCLPFCRDVEMKMTPNLRLIDVGT
ncbi:hypothetical protein [Salibacterium salarium]|uniref:hypothetical protein n=1 Tax=Salibacterium salarium TaxID=284579 RepID=UPI0016398992|nr:hypothetical protein [Salibacterium salarium]